MQRIRILIAVLLLTPFAASAAPFTFSFDMPAFSNGELLGDTSTIVITVDNGGNSFTDQGFLNTQITAVEVVSGIYSFALNTVDDISTTSGSAIYIYTNSLGIPTLDLTGFFDSYFVVRDTDFVPFFQVATKAGSGPIQYSIRVAEGINGYMVGPFSVVGERVISDPGTLLAQLGTTVTGVGPGRSLADKIMLAQTYLAVPDEQSTCAVLDGFLNQVRAQRGKKLTPTFADQLNADAQAIMVAIGCN